MNYKDTLDYLFSQLPMYQRTGEAAYKKDIGNIIEACTILDNPHKKFKSIHIAGTNGKGSTAHIISSILQEEGYTVGLYTSPHLKDFRERIRINGIMISEKDVINFVSKNKIQFEKIKMSFFEYTVALAFNHFANNVDIAIIETGLGGRLDSTNIINPEVSIITNIGYDHINLLGNTLEKIAFEKAGIIKQSVPVVIGRIQKETKNVFLETADKKGAPISFSKKYNYATKSLKGNYQTENINTAISALKILDWKISEENIIKGLDNISINTGIRGRWEQLKNEPLTICDTGHNKDGISNIIRQIKKINYKKLHFVFGSVNDKDLDEILRILPKNATYYFCHAQINRALNSNILKRQALNHKLIGDCFTTVSKAYKAALKSAEKEDLIFIGGSTFVVAEVL